MENIDFDGPGVIEERTFPFTFMFDGDGLLYVPAKAVVEVLNTKVTKAGVNDFIEYLNKQRSETEPRHTPRHIGKTMSNNWKEQFDDLFAPEIGSSPSLWQRHEQRKAFISKEIIEKLIDEIPNIIPFYEHSDGNGAGKDITNLKQQLKDRWLA